MISNGVKKISKIYFLSVALLIFVLFPFASQAGTLLQENWENAWNGWGHEYGGASVVTDTSAIDGTHDLMFTFPQGFGNGNAPDIVAKGFANTKEIWGRAYFKQSSNFVFGSNGIEQKLIFIWGDNFNAYIGIGAWRSDTLYFVWQGDGTTYTGYTGPTIRTGEWYKLDFHMKINSSLNASDGVFQLWVNDVLALNFNNIPYASQGWYNPSAVAERGFDQLAFTPVYGGDSTVPNTQYIWFDAAQISTTPISGGSIAPPPSQYCGDGTCNNGETSTSCSEDCPTSALTPTPTPTSNNPGTVSNLSATAVDTSTVSLSFTQVDDGTGQPAKYDVRYATPAISWGSAQSVASGTCSTPVSGTTIGATKTCTITGLNPSTQYQFQLVSYGGTLNQDAVFGGLSNVVSATTTVQTKTYTLTDFTNLVADWLKSISGSPADFNLDNKVNSKDLGIMMSNWQ